jgi:hypothetical protein
MGRPSFGVLWLDDPAALREGYRSDRSVVNLRIAAVIDHVRRGTDRFQNEAKP